MYEATKIQKLYFIVDTVLLAHLDVILHDLLERIYASKTDKFKDTVEEITDIIYKVVEELLAKYRRPILVVSALLEATASVVHTHITKSAPVVEKYMEEICTDIDPYSQS